MRKRICVLATVMAFSLTGCLKTEVPDLSKVDNDMAAQYMADALLKNDKKYDESLDYDHSILQPTPTPMPTEAPTPVPDRKDEGGSGASAGDSESDGAGASVNDAGNGSEQNSKPVSQVSLSELFGVEGITITPTSYEIKKSYGSDKYASITPSEGNRLLIVHFKIANESGETKRVNLAKKQVRAQIVINGTPFGSALPSIAAGDLQFLNTKLTAGSKMQGVLLFEISKSQQVSDVAIDFSSGSNNTSVSVH